MCQFGHGGREFSQRTYDAAVGNHRWSDYLLGDRIPPDAVFVGFTATRQQTFVCRANHFRELVPGKMIAGQCIVPSNGLEHTYSSSQVLRNP